VQFLTATLILVGYWLVFALYPVPGFDFPYQDYGVLPGWSQLDGFLAHWAKNTNAATEFDRWFLNLFPHPPGERFRFNEGGYATLNFIPSIATMIFGVLAGELLRAEISPPVKLQTLVITGAICLALGTAMDATVCPIVKRIWTPSWVVYSTGWTCWFLAIFYGLTDVRGWKRWAWPLVVVGVNSIAIYVMAQLMKPFVADTLKTHFGPQIFDGPYGSVVRSASILLVFWLICYAMYRQKIFVKI
jgi:predicted acyltransferase